MLISPALHAARQVPVARGRHYCVPDSRRPAGSGQDASRTTFDCHEGGAFLIMHFQTDETEILSEITNDHRANAAIRRMRDPWLECPGAQRSRYASYSS
jgi:hypothetical protein